MTRERFEEHACRPVTRSHNIAKVCASESKTSLVLVSEYLEVRLELWITEHGPMGWDAFRIALQVVSG